MRENRTSGSVRGVLGNRCSYREMAYMKGDVMQKVIVFVFFSMVLFCNWEEWGQGRVGSYLE
jgi:hypothetical protein